MIEGGIRHEPLDLAAESSTAEKYHVTGINQRLKISQRQSLLLNITLF